LADAPHSVPTLSRRLLPPVRPGISPDDAAPRAHHARPNVGTGNVVGPTIGAQHRLMMAVPSMTPRATACRWRAYSPRAAQYCGPGRGKKTGVSGSPVRSPRLETASWPASWAGLRGRRPGSMYSNVHACVPSFIGHLLDTDRQPIYNLLKYFVYINKTTTMSPHGPGRKGPDPPMAGETGGGRAGGPLHEPHCPARPSTSILKYESYQAALSSL
jgi:hypothetical protein